ncbi:MAG: hypothetical protein R3E01_22530 [Pirellulaceae bacterium]
MDTNIAAVARQLCICFAWCGNRVTSVGKNDDIAITFRSRELATAAQRVFPESCFTNFSQQVVDRFREFTDERESLITAPLSVINAEFHRPRSLLMFKWQCSLFDGAATIASLGFLNDDYMPPWDTWLQIVETTSEEPESCVLISWVPEPIGPYVNAGIIADPAESMSWCSLSSAGRIVPHGWGQPWGDDFGDR